MADRPDAKPGRHVELSVIDNGTGMTPQTMAHMFEPFFKAKPVGKGTGLGSATAYGTVQQLGGHIRVDSRPGTGSTFTVCIPTVDRKGAEKEPDRTLSRSRGAETVLLCEAEDLGRNVMCQTLRAAGYTVIETDSGKQALEAAAARDGMIDLLISDAVMPGMDGKEPADTLKPRYSDMGVLFVSGCALDHLDAHGVRGGVVEFLQKPFGPTALLRRVREVIDAERMIG